MKNKGSYTGTGKSEIHIATNPTTPGKQKRITYSKNQYGGTQGEHGKQNTISLQHLS